MAVMLIIAAVVYFLLGETRDAVVLAIALIPVLGVDVLLDAMKLIDERGQPGGRSACGERTWATMPRSCGSDMSSTLPTVGASPCASGVSILIPL